MSPKLFPTVIILLSAAAAIACACEGDLRRTIYWTAASCLNAAVTY